MPSSRELRRRDVGGGEQRVGVGAISGEVHRAIESERVNLAFDVAAQRTVADEQAVNARNTLARARHRANEVERILMANELRDLHDDRRARAARRASRASRELPA